MRIIKKGKEERKKEAIRERKMETFGAPLTVPTGNASRKASQLVK